MTPIEGARWWCRRDYWVISLPYGQKKPEGTAWQKQRLREEDLPKHFNSTKVNVGVLQGEPSGNADADLDCVEAINAWRELGPRTELVFGRKSKRASHHFYRSYPPVSTVKYEDAGKVTLLELRGLKKDGTVGLQTIVPPSVHPCGEPIVFEPGGDGEPAHVDGRMLQWYAAQTAAAALLARHFPAEHAGRHDTFLAIAGMLAHAGWSIENTGKFVRAIYRALWPANPDLRAAELEVETSYRQFANSGEVTGCPTLAEKVADPKVMDKVTQWLNLHHTGQPGPKSHLAPEPWDDPIPLLTRSVPSISADWIPGALGDMAVAVAKATETPLEMSTLLGLPVVSCCLAGKIEVEVEAGYVEPVVVYVAATMESGNRKTAVVNEMTRPLIENEARERRRLEPEIKRAESERKTLEARIDQLRKKVATGKSMDTTLIQEIADTEESLPVVPQVPQFWTQDITTEKLADLMQHNRERMGIFSDEGDLFDLLARYTSGAPNFDLYLHGYSGSPVRVNRISRPQPIFLERPLLSIGISPQPSVLERLRDQPVFRGRGLLSRFFFGLPSSPLGTRKLTPQPCPAAVRAAYQELITRLIQLTPPASDDVWQPYRLKLSPEAYVIWKLFQRNVEVMMREDSKLQYLRDWASKLPGGIARIAGLFHGVVEDPARSAVIHPDMMQRSILLGNALIEHALAAFDLLERDPEVEGAQKILDWIERERCQQFTLRQAFCAHQSRFRRVDAIRPALQLLIEHEYIRPGVPVKVAHRPSEIFHVNPKWLRGA